MTKEDELLLLKLIEGMMHGTSYKHKILKRLLISKMNLDASIEFLQQLGLI